MTFGKQVEDGIHSVPAKMNTQTGKYTLNGWGQTEADFAFFDLPSLKLKDAAVGTALHEFAESYFPQYLAYR